MAKGMKEEECVGIIIKRIKARKTGEIAQIPASDFVFAVLIVTS